MTKTTSGESRLRDACAVLRREYDVRGEARILAGEAAVENRNDSDYDPEQYVEECCDGHAWVIYPHHAWRVCAFNDTSACEEYLGTWPEHVESSDQLACAVAHVTLLCAAREALAELQKTSKEN